MLRSGLYRNLMRCALAMSVLVSSGLSSGPAMASDQNAECQYHIELEYQLNMPIYHWAPKGDPKGVILAMHGLVMHGTTYDELGKTLADQGFLVYATDMRGYGRLTKDYPHEYCSAKDCKQKINYNRSSKDLITLADRIKADHKDLPLYIVGESMGADMAIRVASARPDLADGLILSAPAIRAHAFIDRNTVRNAPYLMANWHQPLNLMPYVKRYASCDPSVVSELSKDPLLRSKMSTGELILSRFCINKTLSFVPNISADKPVLVLQAKDDRCVRADAIGSLMAKLKSKDQQVRWFSDRGHILIETAHIKPDTMETIVSWLNDHNQPKAIQARLVGGEEEVISETATPATSSND